MRKVILSIIVFSVILIVSGFVIIWLNFVNYKDKITEIASMTFQGMVTGFVTFLGLFFTMNHSKQQELLNKRPKIRVKIKCEAGAEQNAYEIVDPEFCLGQKNEKVRSLDCEFISEGAKRANEVKIKISEVLKTIDLDKKVTLYLLSDGKHKLYFEYKDEYGQSYSQVIFYCRKKYTKEYVFTYKF